jgi:hypothetical protein
LRGGNERKPVCQQATVLAPEYVLRTSSGLYDRSAVTSSSAMFNNPLDTSRDLTIRPTLRVLGAIVLTVLAIACAFHVVNLLQSTTVAFLERECNRRSVRRIIFCAFRNQLSSVIPDHVQLPLEIAAGILLVGVTVYGAWRLVSPLVGRKSRQDEAINPSNEK